MWLMREPFEHELPEVPTTQEEAGKIPEWNWPCTDGTSSLHTTAREPLCSSRSLQQGRGYPG